MAVTAVAVLQSEAKTQMGQLPVRGAVFGASSRDVETDAVRKFS
jgi:hypothetical protein